MRTREKVRNITSGYLGRVVRTDRKGVMVLFSSEWCSDCAAFKVTWDNWIAGREGPFYRLEVPMKGREWTDWGLEEVPMVATFVDGAEIDRIQGDIVPSDLDQLWIALIERKARSRARGRASS